MKYLGVDYGSKKIGLAISEESGQMAFPFKVIPNFKALENISKICEEENISKIIFGESKNYTGDHNPIHAEVKTITKDLEKAGYEIDLELEVLSTQEANRIAPKDAWSDARAATIILQSYLDRNKKI